MTGVDVFSAMLLSAELDCMDRFSDPKKIISTIGMCPSVYQSRNSLRHGSTKKLDVSRKLKWIMIQVASVAVRYDDHLKKYYERTKKRHGGLHKVAITHVANKMLRMMWSMHRHGTLYWYRNEKLYQSKLTRLDRATYSDTTRKTKG